jgi:adenine-specific DNA-methyltransferase
MMRDRLELLRRLLTSDGSIWIVIDDNEAHYLKVICDEIFGRQNFFGSITWQHSVQGKNDAKTISLHHNYVLAYRKTEAFQRNLLARREEHNVNYANPDNDPKGLWRSGDVRSPNLRENLCYTVTTPSGKKILPPAKGWRWSKELFSQKVKTGEITFVNNETRVLRKIYLSEQEGRVPESIWFGEEVGTTREATAELSELLPGVTIFATPKPERLIQRVIQIASNPNDWILDSFAGSGTTGAVAHKMGRKWIMCELGEHCHTHIIPRMQKVIGGKDPGGITEDVEWKGGGGFRYYRLAPSLLERDAFDQWVINKKYNPNMLAEAICKLEGFSYAPSETAYWQHGRSTESDFIYITTQTLTRDQLQRLSDEVGESRTLLVMCGAFRIKNTTEFQNLTLKKIPNAVLRKCEWGRDDYSLEIKELPQKPVEALVVQSKPRSKAERRDQASLFEVSGTDGEAK